MHVFIYTMYWNKTRQAALKNNVNISESATLFLTLYMELITPWFQSLVCLTTDWMTGF
jgi:hypothetical protein